MTRLVIPEPAAAPAATASVAASGGASLTSREPSGGILYMQLMNEAGNAVIAHRPFLAIDRDQPTSHFAGRTDRLGVARVEGVPSGDYLLCLEDVEDMAVILVLRPGDYAQSQLLGGDFREPTGGFCEAEGDDGEACIARREAKRARPLPCNMRKLPP